MDSRSFVLDATDFLVQETRELRCGRIRSGLEFESVHGEFDVDSNWIYCVLDVALLGFSIIINDPIRVGLGLDSGWILGGFGVDLRGFASFFLDSLFLCPPLASFSDVFLSDPDLDLSAQLLIL